MQMQKAADPDDNVRSHSVLEALNNDLPIYCCSRHHLPLPLDRRAVWVPPTNRWTINPWLRFFQYPSTRTLRFIVYIFNQRTSPRLDLQRKKKTSIAK